MPALEGLTGPQLLSLKGGDATATSSAPGALPPPVTEPEPTDFSSISNVLKTKHDTAKNSVSNIR